MTGFVILIFSDHGIDIIDKYAEQLLNYVITRIQLKMSLI